MANSNWRLIPQRLQDGIVKLLSPLIALFSKWGLNPNSFTIAGVVITAMGAAAFLMGYIRLAGAMILLGGFCDTIDGLLARTTGRASRFGALLDSTVDRYSEFIMFLGIAAHFFYTDDFGTSAATFLALCGSFMVSYTRSRAESLGFARCFTCLPLNSPSGWLLFWPILRPCRESDLLTNRILKLSRKVPF